MKDETLLSDDLLALLGRSSGNVYLRSVSNECSITITPDEARKLLEYLKLYLGEDCEP